MQPSIMVKDLGKRYHRYHIDRPTTFQEAVVRRLRGMTAAEQFWALRQVNFTIPQGRMVGVIGANGAGKSTLLRLIGGVGRPDEGTVKIQGRIGALLDLGAGFHPDLTGRENVFVAGVIAGLTRQEVAQRLEAIVNFAELEAFIDSPLRTYSTGMKMRLAFAVSAHIEPEILLIDEVLAVGDIAFQQKCLARIEQFKKDGCTILLVSHDSASVRQLCDEALWLNSGQLVAYGPAEIVVDQYVSDIMSETKQRTPPDRPALPTAAGNELRINENRFGTLEMEIVAVRLLDLAGLPVTEIKKGDALQIELQYSAPQPIEAPIFGVTLTLEDGFICYDTNTAVAGLTLPTTQGRGHVTLRLDRLDLNGRKYNINAGVYEKNWAYAYDYHWQAYSLKVQPTGGEKGVLCPPYQWEIRPSE
jgi:lipopolysaccharide transport system ATP-binding protein